MHTDTAAVTIQSNKSVSNEVKDNWVLLGLSTRKKLNELFGQPNTWRKQENMFWQQPRKKIFFNVSLNCTYFSIPLNVAFMPLCKQKSRLLIADLVLLFLAHVHFSLFLFLTLLPMSVAPSHPPPTFACSHPAPTLLLLGHHHTVVVLLVIRVYALANSLACFHLGCPLPYSCPFWHSYA